MRTMPLSESLSLPTDAATQTFAFIGRKGSGKTYGAGKLVELLIERGVQVVILDSVGNWYGLRLAADGRGAGLDVAIVGGLRGDVPLEATGGALVADVVADSGRSLIIDVSQFSKGDRQRFATAFGERLWQRKKAEHDPTPVHLVIEESQLIVPEAANRQADAARMVGIYEEIIRLGRNYGIGVTMITQRPQSVSKEVLNQTECLMVFQVNGAHERKALKDWIVHQGMDTSLLAELPSLKPGHCYVWSPQWLEILQRIRIAPKRTFDSTGTPKAGAPRQGRRELKPIDLEDLKAKMAATIQRAKADDPKELRRQIADLQRQLAAKPTAPAAEVRTVEVPVLQPDLLARAEALLAGVVEFNRHLAGEFQKVLEALEELGLVGRELRGALQAAQQGGGRAATVPPHGGANRGSDRGSAAGATVQRRESASRSPAGAAPVRRASEGSGAGDGVLTDGQQRIIDTVATLTHRGLAPSIERVAEWLDVHPNGGRFRGNWNAVHADGYLSADHQLTEKGDAAANQPQTGVEAVRRILTHGQLRIFEVVESGAHDLDTVAAHLGVHPNGGRFRGNFNRLRRLGVMTSSGELAITEAAYR